MGVSQAHNVLDLNFSEIKHLPFVLSFSTHSLLFFLKKSIARLTHLFISITSLSKFSSTSCDFLAVDFRYTFASLLLRSSSIVYTPTQLLGPESKLRIKITLSNTTMADADAPVTTLVPFNTLPSCVSDCGPLYDANGGCVPPGVAEGSEDTYINCFCQNSAVQGLYNDPPLDICNGNCAADPTGYTSLRDWFTDFCIGVQAGVAGATSTADSSSSASNSNSNGGGDW